MQQNAKELSASRALLHPLKIAVIRNSPASRQTAWCWASFMLRFGAFLRIKSPMCRSFFYAVLTYCALPITVTARSWSKNEHLLLLTKPVSFWYMVKISESQQISFIGQSALYSAKHNKKRGQRPKTDQPLQPKKKIQMLPPFSCSKRLYR